eukprot:scaffold49115_cov62-Phaeocystis_antarctica.AAC.1
MRKLRNALPLRMPGRSSEVPMTMCSTPCRVGGRVEGTGHRAEGGGAEGGGSRGAEGAHVESGHVWPDAASLGYTTSLSRLLARHRDRGEVRTAAEDLLEPSDRDRLGLGLGLGLGL